MLGRTSRLQIRDDIKYKKKDLRFATGDFSMLEFDLLQISLTLKKVISSVNVLVLAE